MPGGEKGHIYLKKPASKRSWLADWYVLPFVTTKA